METLEAAFTRMWNTTASMRPLRMFPVYHANGLEELCKFVRRRVQRHIGLQVSIGVAQTKTLAKVANRLAKRRPELSGVCIGTETESFGRGTGTNGNRRCLGNWQKDQ